MTNPYIAPEPCSIPEKRKLQGCRGCLIKGTVFLVVFFGVLYVVSWWTGPIRYLQFHASEVRDHYDDADGGWTGDFSRRISAKCSEETFHEYAALQGMTTRLNKDTAVTVKFGWGGGNRSWCPPANLEGAYYFYREGGERRLLAWDGKRLYYSIDVC